MSVEFHGGTVVADNDTSGVSFWRLDRGFVLGLNLPFQALKALGGLAAQIPRSREFENWVRRCFPRLGLQL